MEAILFAARMALAETDVRILRAALSDIRRISAGSLEKSPVYGPHGSATESSVQDAVDLLWFSFPDDEIVVEEWFDGRMVALWTIPPNPNEPPTASPQYRTEV